MAATSHHVAIGVLNHIVDNYPRPRDPHFSQKLLNFKEFYEVYSKKTVEQQLLGLRLHQNFIQRFINPATLYDRLLLVHITGSGKTWTMASIIDSFRLVYKHKAIVLVQGETAEYAFRTNMKEWYDTYYHGAEMSYEKYIDKYIQFSRYIKMSKALKKLSDETIIERFSDRVIMVDEAHRLNIKKSESDKSTYVHLARLLGLVKNSRIVVSTATPIVDIYHEIFSLVNLVLPIEERLENQNQTLAKLTLASYGRVSYFMEPGEEKPRIINVGVKVDKYHQHFVFLRMKGDQLQAYLKVPKNANDMYTGVRSVSLCVLPNVVDNSISNVIYEKKAITGTYFRTTSAANFCSFNSPNVIQKIRRAVHEDTLDNYSCKLAYVFREMFRSERVGEKCFLFCRQVKAFGITSISAYLSALGFEFYNNEKCEEILAMTPIPRFTIITGEGSNVRSVSGIHARRIDTFNHPKNLYGEYIKILIVSDVGSESLSLKCVRQVHILTPFWNNNKTLQVVARAVRINSHIDLPVEKRFVRIYKYVAICEPSIDLNPYVVSSPTDDVLHHTIDDVNFEQDIERSIDLREQCRANDKMAMTNEVNKILKKVSIDFHLSHARSTSVRKKYNARHEESWYRFYRSLPVGPVLNFVCNQLRTSRTINIDDLCHQYKLSRVAFERVIHELQKGSYTVTIQNIPHGVSVLSDIIHVSPSFGISDMNHIQRSSARRMSHLISKFEEINLEEESLAERNIEQLRTINSLEDHHKRIVLLNQSTKNGTLDLLYAIETSFTLALESNINLFRSAICNYKGITYHMALAILWADNNYNTSADMNISRLLNRVRIFEVETWWDYTINDPDVLEALAVNYNSVREEKAKQGHQIYAYHTLSDNALRIKSVDQDQQSNKRLKKRGRVVENYNNDKELKSILLRIVFHELTVEQINLLSMNLTEVTQIQLTKTAGVSTISKRRKRGRTQILSASDDIIHNAVNPEEIKEKYPNQIYLFDLILELERKEVITAIRGICYTYNLYDIIL